VFVLRKAKKKDGLDVFNWRNDPDTRKASFSIEKITYEAHEQWFENFLKSTSGVMYIGVYEGTSVGVVRADKDEKGFEISWNVAPDKRKKGFGKQMVKALIDKLDATCFAKVKPTNTASQKIARFSGMRLLKETPTMLIYVKEKV
jgi:RimJ/RimL family protein N-acetyltransferase